MKASLAGFITVVISVGVAPVMHGASGPPSAEAASSFSLPVFGGWNLISFPRPLVDKDLPSVMGSSEVTKVVTAVSPGGNDFCDPFGLGGGGDCPLSAEKVDGTWVGPLTTIDFDKAYWVLSTGATSIDVDLVEPDAAGTPWPVPVAPGWNLVPIRNLERFPVPGTFVDADEMFSDIFWSVALTYDPTVPGGWKQFDPESAAQVKVGLGIWISSTAFGNLYTSMTVPPEPPMTPIPGLTYLGSAVTISAMGVLLVWRRRHAILPTRD